ncbi:diaminopimelate epimerase [Candidatus Fermentibacteria bacterium]|nr:diaminopimelate epimerase [Candidatus Fermentibacteria bacterium]
MKFCKMSGSGNDFIVVDNTDGSLDGILDPGMISGLCRRGLAIGADGLLELLRSPVADFAMRYYNSDGHPASMCGNGGRCIARFALDRGVAGPGLVTFTSDSGIHRALVDSSWRVRLWMTEPRILAGAGKLRLDDVGIVAGLADTGVPHLVVEHEDLRDGVFERVAPILRRHAAAGPAGANVDFVSSGRGRLEMRTWERGVEGETLACGTGAVAVALLLSQAGRASLPVEILTRGGLELAVGRDEKGWWLEGEARIVYRGETVAPRVDGD